MECSLCWLSLATLATLGGAVTLAFVWSLLCVLGQVLRRGKELKEEFGEWSVVTGPTSGIGQAMALELARKQQNLVLVARNRGKVESLAEEISRKFQVRVETLCMDLSEATAQDMDRYARVISDKDVGILVNNAGLAYEFVTYFDEVSEERIQSMIQVNVQSATLLIRKTIPGMIQRGKGAVINISSAGATVPHELHAVYAATKAYLLKLTRDLALEYGSKGIAFQVQVPYFVVSAMSKIRRSSLTVPSPEAYARHAVRQIGYSGVLSPYPTHALIMWAIAWIPTFLLERVVGQMHHAIRRKAMKKYTKKD